MSGVLRFAPAKAQALGLWLMAGVLLAGCPVAAQDKDKTYTLHVYTNLFQIPTLVVDGQMHLFPPIDTQRFNIRIDSKRAFTPRHARLEGNDPISLVVLIDASGGQNRLLPTLAEAFSTLAPEDLHQQDRVYFYALDCSLVHTVRPLGAEPQQLAAGVKTVLSTNSLHLSADAESSCHTKPHLYDAVSSVVRAMSNLPGRRVVLLISDGYDGGSKLDFRTASRSATSYGVTLFGIDGGETSFDIGRTRAAFGPMCQQTGGIVLPTDAKHVSATIKEFMSLVRGRYILEFQFPGNLTKGNHIIAVDIRKLQAVVLPAGTSAPIVNPQTDGDIEHETPGGNERKDSPSSNVNEHSPTQASQ